VQGGAIATFTDLFGRRCRLYAQQITVESSTTGAWATMCRDRSGKWALAK